jgi:hypothetical protein
LEWRTQQSQAEASVREKSRSGSRRMDEEDETETAIFFSLLRGSASVVGWCLLEVGSLEKTILVRDDYLYTP